MRRFLLAAAFCVLAAPAWAQCSGQFPANTVCGNPTGSPIQPGPVPATAFSTISGIGPTRAAIPATNTHSGSFVSAGYFAANDKGFGAPYVCAGQTSNSILAIQDSAGSWCALNLAATDKVEPGWFGAKADDGATTISSGDITANPQWRGTYVAGTTWDTVGVQESKYAAYAGTSTPGVIHWNANVTTNLNLQWSLPNGTYGINKTITSVQTNFVDWFGGKGSALLDWQGPSNQSMWFCNSCAYGQIYNLTVGTGIFTDYGAAAPLVSLDCNGCGSLKTQQVTLYDIYCAVGYNQQCLEISKSGGNAQGDTVTFVNPVFVGSYSDAAIILGGDNALEMVILNGDCQGFINACIRNNGGSFSLYGTHFENQNHDFTDFSPVLMQPTTAGADVDSPAGISTVISVINGARSESAVLFKNEGGSPTDIMSGETIGADIIDWFQDFAYLPGVIISPTVTNTKGRQFLLVDVGGNEAWKPVTSVSGVVLTDSTASYSVNQWVDYDIQWRFGSNAFTFRCPIVSNTATTITASAGCNGGTLPTPNAGSRYLISGRSSITASEPNWDTATAGHRGIQGGNSNQGFSTLAGSNLVAVGADAGSISVNDYIMIPNADNINAGGAAAGAPTLPSPLLAKVTAKSASPCAWAVGGGLASCLTVSRNAAYTVGDTTFGITAFYGTPIADNHSAWIEFPFFNVSGARIVQGYATRLGKIGGNGTDISVFQPNRLDWIGPGFSNPQLPSIALDNKARLSFQCPSPDNNATPIDLTICMQGSNNVVIAPNQDTTYNASVPYAGVTQDFAIMIGPGGVTPRKLTFGTNFSSNGPMLTVNGVAGMVLFRSNGTVWQEVARSSYGPASAPLLYSVAGTPLPSCTAANKGAQAVVSDATAPTYNATYTGSSTVVVPVLCNGTNWTTH